MKIIQYRYSNGKIKEHTKYIKKNTILKECENSSSCNIYEKITRLEKNWNNEKQYVIRYRYITTFQIY